MKLRNHPLAEAPLLRLAVCLMAGIVAGTYLHQPVPLLPLLVAAVVVALLLWKHELWQSAAIAVCMVLLGWLLAERQQESLRVEWPAGAVCYEAVVLSEPEEKPKTVLVDVAIAGNGRKLKCYLQKSGRSQGLRTGDGLRICSRISENPDWRRGTFDARRYLLIHGFTGRTYVRETDWQRAEVSLRSLSRLERTRLLFLKWRSRLLQRLAPNQSAGDAYAVVAAMVLGDKSALTRQLRETYAVTGASHVLALSGLHLGIVYSLLSLLTVRRRWRNVSQLLSVVGIWAFVFLVGMPTSVVRSAVMLTVYALLALGHRDKMSVNTLAFTAVVMLMLNPLALFDVGFQLSFMAVFAILLFVPLFQSVWSEAYLMDHRVLKWLWGMVSVSCSAQVGVAPLIAYYFGRFSTYFLLTNFVVVPAAVLMLWLAPAALLLPPLAYLLLYIAGGLNRALELLAMLPGASIGGLHPKVLQVAMVYVIIGALYLLAGMAQTRSEKP